MIPASDVDEVGSQEFLFESFCKLSKQTEMQLTGRCRG